ncbi:unnamed protein product [Trichobilharzia szidati]|nr:unnamed protein product [Trichobilharzia szidati]
MNIKICLVCLILFLSLVKAAAPQRIAEEELPPGTGVAIIPPHQPKEITTKSESKKTDQTKQTEKSFDEDSSEKRTSKTTHQSADDDRDVETYFISGKSESTYKTKDAGKLRAEGKFRSRGIGRYGTISSEGTKYSIEGTFDRYGRRRPTKSKFKTYGREKRYSKKIVDNRFDINGKVLEERRHRKTGNYEAKGTHARFNVRNEDEKNTKETSKNQSKQVDKSEKKEKTKKKKVESKENTMPVVPGL